MAQAVSASTAAYKAGVKLQKLELLLPLIGATDLDDWYDFDSFTDGEMAH